MDAHLEHFLNPKKKKRKKEEAKTITKFESFTVKEKKMIVAKL